MTVETEKLSDVFDQELRLEPLSGDPLEAKMEEATDCLALVLFSVTGFHDWGEDGPGMVEALMQRMREDSLRKVVSLLKAAKRARDAGDVK